MCAFIPLGDRTDHGDEVITASGPQIYGKNIALVSDKVKCPQSGHGAIASLSNAGEQ